MSSVECREMEVLMLERLRWGFEGKEGEIAVTFYSSKQARIALVDKTQLIPHRPSPPLYRSRRRTDSKLNATMLSTTSSSLSQGKATIFSV